jgi:hypothetical protein
MPVLRAGLTVRDANGDRHIDLTRDDLVFFTNGSLTQNTTTGDTHTVAPMNTGTADRGCFTLWERVRAPRLSGRRGRRPDAATARRSAAPRSPNALPVHRRRSSNPSGRSATS